MHWRHGGSPRKTKFKQTLSAQKFLCTVFWDRRGILLVDILTRGEMMNAKHCRNCDGPFRTRAGCVVPVLSCCTITLSQTRFDGPLISCRSSAGRYLIILPIARTSRPVISIFSYTSRNSCPVSISVFRMTMRRRWVSHCDSNSRRLLGHRDAKVGPAVWQVSHFRRWIYWKIAQHFLYLLQYIFPLNWVLFL